MLFRLEPERAHDLAMQLLTHAGPFLPRLGTVYPSLARTVFGLRFPHPVGLAAGFDKNAVALPAWERLGFGFVEAGTITARAQGGNAKPRVFRFPEHSAIINRLGFNNDGAEVIAGRLDQLRRGGKWPGIPLGINIGKSKVTPLEEAAADYVFSFEKLRPFADYFVLNVSSPNTPGLRGLQDKAALEGLLRAVRASNLALARQTDAVERPVLVKIAPDLDWAQIDAIVEVALAHGIAGLVATNTTVDHSAVSLVLREQGGLSGRPLRKRSTEIVRHLAARTALPIIGVGGISDGASAREKLDAGAALVQIYTGFIYRGPPLIREICANLAGSA